MSRTIPLPIRTDRHQEGPFSSGGSGGEVIDGARETALDCDGLFSVILPDRARRPGAGVHVLELVCDMDLFGAGYV